MKLFDLHCDTIWACETKHQMLASNDLHIDVQKLQNGQSYAQCFAAFIDREECKRRKQTPYARYQELLSCFRVQQKANADCFIQALTPDDLSDIEAAGKIAAILTVEGGEVLEEDLKKLDALYADGVRMLTLTWNYENELGYPHGIGGHLKPFGFEVVERMNELGMIVDVSHLSDEGFYDVLRHSQKPIAASHSCARSICAHTRNLSDDMLRAIGEKGGVVGINFYGTFLEKEGAPATPELICRHARHILRLAGEDAPAFGSDYDGMDGEISWGNYAGSQQVVDCLSREFTPRQLEKICYRNAKRLWEENNTSFQK